MAGVYNARPSTRTAGIDVAHDGVVWKERLAVVEGVTPEGNPRLFIRSYFRNPTTHDRVWDEPPSGASGVDFATPAMRKYAEEQMKELQFTLDLIPPDQQQQQQEKQQAPTKKGLFGGRFKGKKKEKPTLKDESKDLNLQRAIAMSMADQHGGGGSSRSNTSNNNNNDPRILFDSEFSQPVKSNGTRASTTQQRSFDDDLAMAKALSLSASGQQQPVAEEKKPITNSSYGTTTADMTEEEMLQMALEQSRNDMYAVPSPSKVPPPPQQQQQQQQYSSRKPAPVNTAAPKSTRPPTSKTPSPKQHIGPYDPMSPQHVNSTPRSTTPTSAEDSASEAGEAREQQQNLYKIPHQGDNALDRKKPARSLSRRMFASRRRMEAKAGVL